MLLVSIALAAPPDLHDELLARFESESGHGGCLTGLVMDLKDNWRIFSPAEQVRITSILGPLKREVAAAEAFAPPVANLGSDTCYGQWGENRVTGDHFVVEWDDGTVSESVAQDFLDAIEYGYEVEVEQEGWNAPEGDDRYLMMVYIQDQDMGGAYTTVDSCGGRYIPYIVAGRDAVQMGTWTEEMAAHELNHALQFSYSFASEFWWWEATATYIEEIVLPETNGWSDYVAGYTYNPHLEMAGYGDGGDAFWHMYGMAIWAFYLHDYQGGTDAVRETWENASGERGQYTYGAGDMVRDLGLDWQETYVDFITRNVSMDYDQHRFFPGISVVESVRSFPASGESVRATRPEGYGQNYIQIHGGGGDGNDDLHLVFSGDDDVEWAVVLAETDGEAVLRSEHVISEDGVAELTLPDYGDDDVFLVVSPLEEDDDSHTYAWELELVEGDAVDTGDDDTDDANLGDDTDDDGLSDELPARPVGGDTIQAGAGGCGCASPGPAAPLAGWLLGLSVLAVRRRK